MITVIKNDKYDNVVNNIVYSAFFIHQLFFLFSVSAMAKTIPEVRKGAHLVIIISFFIMCLTVFYYFLRGKFSIREIIIYIIIATPLLISLYNYRVVMVISNLLYAAIFKNVDIKKSIRVVLYATIIGFLINVILSITTPYVGRALQTRYGEPRIRYALGFYYAYITSYYYLTIVLMFILAFNKFNLILYLTLAVFNVVVFIFTDTKAAFTYAMIALLLHLVFIRFNFKFLFIIFKKVVIVIFPISTILAILLPMFYVEGVAFWDFINRIVNNRLILTQRAIDACGWKWFGQNAQIWNEGVHHIDSAITSMFVQNGLIVLIMSVAFMTFFAYMAVKINHKPLMIVLFIIAIRSIFDMGFMTMQLGPVIIMFYDVFNKYKSGIKCDY